MNILLVPDEYEPISNYKLELIKEAQKVLDTNSVIFIYEKRSQGDRIFTQEEKLVLLGSAIPNSLSPKYIIDGNSFKDINTSLYENIQMQKEKHKDADLFLLLDSREFNRLKDSTDLIYILTICKLVLYVFPEDKEILERLPMTTHHPLLIANSVEISKLSKASIFNVHESYFSPLIIEYMNKSSECAIKRIKNHLSDSRFKHSLRVAGTVQKIHEIIELKDMELRYDSYIAALYHDICKEFSNEALIEIAASELGIFKFPHPKVLHGPVGAWYISKYYLFPKGTDILEAIAQHTVPSVNPKPITKLLFLADHLELNKKDRYPQEVYENIWNLIEAKDIDKAFSTLIAYCDAVRAKKSK
ncbi:nicotinate-nucleotide adenylyltransferase [Candidatus Mycoplasma haematobovis]|uniref:bis(5'-nucleosyl)-tetraphosphatase (symmetrical) n=2 Tax=Candidatus Mycoplasma haematobovis TaxID=432608 RepID=A0A1A9QFI0_9MOLU|nr:nicotinate-nucleotide adenylyltransferase [Candidatus Mycoplasma haematobovis]